MARTQGSHAQITGPRIRKAAQRLFAQQGYAAVSMRVIAREVGVQAGALYNYIPDKQTLLYELMRDHLLELHEAVGPCLVGPAPARLEAFVRFHIAFHHARPEEVFIAYMELRNLTPENFAEIEGLRRRYERVLAQMLHAGVREGAFSVPDEKVASMAIIAMLTGVNTWFREDGRLSLGDVQDMYWQMVARMVSVGGTVPS
ncbi:MAG: TetR/AcrR family transcriptional regulator [Pseudomonadota bacterium]